MTQNKEVPPASEAESKKPTDWTGIGEYVKFREAHDKMAHDAFGIQGDPYHFERLMRFPGHLFDEPPDESELKEERQAQVEAERNRVLDSLETFWEAPVAAGEDVPQEER